MKREALAFFRILPAGAADIGDEVTRQELRDADAGAWSMQCTERDDLRDAFPDEPWDEPVCLDEQAAGKAEGAVHLTLKTA